MEQLFLQSNQIIDQITTIFKQIERCQGNSETEIIYEDEIKLKLVELDGIATRLEVYIQKEPVNRRQLNRTRLNQIKYDATHLEASLQNSVRSRVKRLRDASNREELLNRKFTTNSGSSSSSQTFVNIDEGLKFNNSLQNANSNIDDMLQQGYNILTNLRDQGGILKRTKRRMLDFKNHLNLSNTVMGLIERRAYQDKFVLFIGMGVTLIVMFFVYMYFV